METIKKFDSVKTMVEIREKLSVKYWKELNPINISQFSPVYNHLPPVSHCDANPHSQKL